MNVRDAQQEMRSAFLGGFAGQLVSGLIWLVASALSFWVAARIGMAVLFFGSMFTFPLVGGALLGVYGPSIFSLGGWLTAVVLIIFAFLGRAIVRKEEQQNVCRTL